MSSQQNWVEALKISPESLSAWSAQAPSGTPLLVYCIEHGHIAIDQYFQWAQAHFEVPVLDSRFFLEAFDESRVADVRAQGDWHPWQFPVEKWDGVVIVACVEVPTEEERGNYKYVLADPRAMRDVWASTSGSSTASRPPAAPALESSYDAPIGISTTAKPFKLNLDLSAAMEATTEDSESQASIRIDQGTSSGTALPELPDLPATPDPGTNASVVTEMKPKRDLTREELVAIKDLFTQLGTRYQRSFIAKVVDYDAVVSHWDERMPIDAGPIVSLAQPTFLRIVAKTLMPYHGYLMDSPAHRELFQALSYEALPPCVTAIPLKTDGNLWAILVAIGTDQNQKMDSLTFVQETTDAFMAKLGTEWLKAS